MRKFTTVILSIMLVAAVSTTADAAKKKRAKGKPAAAVSVGEASDAQRAKFWQDAWNPAGAK
jgi:hypothetical protein